ncbi:hypothetical protein NPIL_241191 [Nephila pilipes]|uniref:Uncharacterized protein n=1 Tax=Nephila pilipes TaxID=299642 RepID=A0A8X6PJQ8_NEPPI|nr:hypothetical protein NPIL_546441 [Nephila pilipes]GFT98477.1 hypothetical protein NPIL_241191 [Nephila pilipes]
MIVYKNIEDWPVSIRAIFSFNSFDFENVNTSTVQNKGDDRSYDTSHRFYVERGRSVLSLRERFHTEYGNAKSYISVFGLQSKG